MHDFLAVTVSFSFYNGKPLCCCQFYRREFLFSDRRLKFVDESVITLVDYDFIYKALKLTYLMNLYLIAIIRTR